MRMLFPAILLGLSSMQGFAADQDHIDNNHRHHHEQGAVASSEHHLHGAGEWMLSYRYMHMSMDGMRDDTNDLSRADVLADFMVAPIRMSMDMHMFGLMYGLSDDVTVMAMLPYLEKDMDHITRMGARFTTRSSGIGDIKLVGLYNLKQNNGNRLQFKLGVSAPSGDIDAEDDTPAMADAQLPYPMQLGSGSWEFLPGIIYSSATQAFDWGTELDAVIRLNDNDNEYRLGNRLALSGWASKPFNHTVSGILRLKAQLWDDIDGNDSALNPAMVPTADPDNQGGKRVDISAGLLVSPPTGALSEHTFGIEIGTPLYEDLNGPQMSLDWSLMAKWQLVLH